MTELKLISVLIRMVGIATPIVGAVLIQVGTQAQLIVLIVGVLLGIVIYGFGALCYAVAVNTELAKRSSHAQNVRRSAQVSAER